VERGLPTLELTGAVTAPAILILGGFGIDALDRVATIFAVGFLCGVLASILVGLTGKPTALVPWSLRPGSPALLDDA
jgi:hypothetical protein